jgi:DNA (cytosine-5)-methyltransferase 1
MRLSERPPDPAAPRYGALFAGYGGLELGAQAVLGGSTAWVSEIDPGACRILAHRYPDVPNLGDITAINWAQVEPVDVLTGGFPCQDVSHAGARKGLGPGTRSGLWSRMADAIDHLRPSLVIAENVRGLLSADAASDMEPCPWCLGDGAGEPPLRALGAVLADLAELGYDASWYGLRAADVGAPHGRFRVFVLAWPAGTPAHAACSRPRQGDDAGEVRRLDGGSASAAREWERARSLAGGGVTEDAPADTHSIGPVRAGGSRGRRDGLADGRGHAVPDATGHGRDEGRPEPARLIGGSDASVSGDGSSADADGDGLEGLPQFHGAAVLNRIEEVEPRGHADRLVLEARGLDWGNYEPAIRRWERCLGRPAPAPTEPGSKGQPRLSPAFVEFLMGLPAGWVTDVPGLSRNDQLKALGNGVVPQQAAAAVRFLLARLAEERRWAA